MYYPSLVSPIYLLTVMMIGMMIYDRVWQSRGKSLGLTFNIMFLSVIVISVILHAITFGGFMWAFQFLAVCAFIPYLIEIIGINTGVPFGKYKYGDAIGPRLPLGIPFAVAGTWMITLYCSFILNVYLGVCLERLQFEMNCKPYEFFGVNENCNFAEVSIRFLMMTSLYAVFFDRIIEPLAVKHNYWSWEQERAAPSLFTRLLGNPWQNIPTVNFIGWFITAFVTLYIATQFIYFNSDTSFPWRPVTRNALPILWGGCALWYLSGAANKFGLIKIAGISRLAGKLFVIFFLYIAYLHFGHFPHISIHDPGRM